MDGADFSVIAFQRTQRAAHPHGWAKYLQAGGEKTELMQQGGGRMGSCLSGGVLIVMSAVLSSDVTRKESRDSSIRPHG